MKKILIIEDEAALLYALSASLQVDGFDVVTANNGREGLKFAKSEKPNLIILDLRLPEMDGFEVLENLKKEKSMKTIPVMIVTNIGEKEAEEKCKKLGAAEYIVKADHSLHEISETIKKFLK